jgi:hypothetical protein
LFVDDISIGTVCATDSKPNSVGPHRRAEMFGLVRHVERFLEAYYRQPEGSVERDIVERLTRIAMESITTRWMEDSQSTNDSMVSTEKHVDYIYDRLGEMGDLPEVYKFSDWK